MITLTAVQFALIMGLHICALLAIIYLLGEVNKHRAAIRQLVREQKADTRATNQIVEMLDPLISLEALHTTEPLQVRR